MPPQGDQCPFCQLIENPQQLITVGETENFYAWLEVQPRARGHANVVPKEHKESILEFSPSEYHEAMTLVRETIEKAFDGLGADGASITMNVKEAGGQMLPHAYIQVFPRFEDDENAGTPTGAIFQHREDLQDEEKLEEIQGEMNSVSPSFEEEKVEPHPASQIFQEDTGEEPDEEAGGDKGENEDEPEEVERGESFEWI